MASHPKVPSASSETPLEPGERLARPFQRFAMLSSAGGLVLLACTIVAIVWANSGWSETYLEIFYTTKLKIEMGTWSIAMSVQHWINDLLMAVFFLLVGLEIKRELLVGELASARKAALPIAAALGGMVVPALIYVALNFGQDTVRGWGVPMATDIAFALGIMALLGSRVPVTLKIFLTSLAIVDDLGALLVIALFYTDDISFVYLRYSGIALAVLLVMNRLRIRYVALYLLVGLPLWYFVYKSGIHATIAGVALAMMIPAHPRVDSEHFSKATRRALGKFEEAAQLGHNVRTNSAQRAAALSIERSCVEVLPPLHRLEGRLHTWVAFLIVPVFALSNAGADFGSDAGSAITSRLSLGIVLGLLIGKPVGIVGFCWVASKLGIGSLPEGTTWRHIIGAAFLAGIGFTMALFIANLAFLDQAQLESAKLGVFIASFIAAVVGLVILATAKAPETDT